MTARAPAHALLALLTLLGACAKHEAPAPVTEAEDLPEAAPVGVNEVAVIQPAGARLWLGTTAGVVTFVPDTGAWTLVRGDATTSDEHVRGIAVAADGTAWTAHGAEAESEDDAEDAAAPATGPAPPRAGGVRAFRPDGSVRAWFATDGLPSDDVVAIAALPGVVVAATSAGLATLKDGADRFEPLDLGAKRRLTLIDPESGGAARSLTEFRPRDERVTALAAAGSRLWIGTNHGLLARDGDALLRVKLPACRRDGHAPDVVSALGLRPDGVVVALDLDTPNGPDPSGLVEIIGGGGASRCHVPGVDVPASLTPAVASDGTTTWMATYEGLVRVRGGDVLLFERGQELPDMPPTAVAVDGKGGAWVGVWGRGVARVRDRDVTTWKLGSGSSGTAVPSTKSLS